MKPIKMSYVKKAVITALCVALCVVLPMAFHSIPDSGKILLPMHIPVLLCGLLCGPFFGLLSGVLGPLMSSLITGMPPLPYLPSMLIELAVYGFFAGLGMLLLRTKSHIFDLVASLLIAMIIGRIVAGAAKSLIFAPGTLTLAGWAATYFVTALPGLVIQIVILPLVVFGLEKAKLIPKRY